jgi:hypothetical protein
MSCHIVNPRLIKVDKTYFYLENGYGVDMFKMHIKNPYLHPTIVVFANRRAMILPNVLLLRKIYKMQ